MPLQQIKHRATGAVLFQKECDSIKRCVEAAIDSGANLYRANLYRANLCGANLSDANLSDAVGVVDGLNVDPADVPVIENIDAEILKEIKAGGTLDMESWHGPTNHWCGTTHCRAGWAVHLAGEKGKELQDRVGPQMAGTLIYHASRPDQPAPWFFDNTENALADIRKCAAEQTRENE